MSLFRALLTFLVSLSVLHASDWQELRGCQFIPNEFNDGDSFHVKHSGKEYIFRLYFVDTPESEDSLPERVAEQAAWFGTTPARAIEVGRYAKHATAQILSKPFTVLTKLQDARGRSKLPRYYAFITTADKEDLGEVLVTSGLARAFGVATAPPGEQIGEMRAKYDKFQARARRDQLGAWGSGNSIRRSVEEAGSPKPPEKENVKPVFTGSTSPEQGVDAATTVAILDDLDPLNRIQVPTKPNLREPGHQEPPNGKPNTAGEPATSALSVEININNAAKAELEKLPGVGPAIAARIIEGRPFATIDDLRRIKGLIPLNSVDGFYGNQSMALWAVESVMERAETVGFCYTD